MTIKVNSNLKINIDFLPEMCYTIPVIKKKGIPKMTVTKDTLIGDVLDFDVETAKFFFEIGMHCLGCPHSRGESIEDACLVHGTNADELVAKINGYLATK